MIARLIALLFLISLLAGGVWYFFRDTPQKKVKRWREVSQRMFESRGELGERALAKAEEYNEKILALYPDLSRDLLFKARLLLTRGTQAGYAEAVEIYDKLLAKGDPQLAVTNLYKCMALRALGRYQEAYGAALSVIDAFPFQAHLELAQTALAEYSPTRAIAYAMRGRDSFAKTSREKAIASEGIAEGYKLLMTFSQGSRRDGADLDEASRARRARVQEEWRSKAMAALEEARRFLMRSRPENEAEAEQLERHMYRVISEQADLRDEGAAPIVKGLEEFSVWTGEHAKVRSGAPELKAILGLLQIRAIDEERHALDNQGKQIADKWSQDAHEALVEALLGKTADEAVEQKMYDTRTEGSEESPEDELPTIGPIARERRQYVGNLITIANALLSSKHHACLLRSEKHSPLDTLDLERRVADGRQSPDEGVAALFKLATGLAHLKEGEVDKGERLLGEYFESAPIDRKPVVALNLANQVFRVSPGTMSTDGSGPLVLNLFDRFAESGGSALEQLGRRLELLNRFRGNETLERGASERILAAQQKAKETAEKENDALLVARILHTTAGVDEAIQHLRESRKKASDERRLTRALGELLIEKARKQISGNDRDAALDSYREALEEHIRLFLNNPAASQDVVEYAWDIQRLLQSERRSYPLDTLLAELFSGASEEDRATFEALFKSYLTGDFRRALQQAASIRNPGSFSPTLSFIKGGCHVGISRKASGPAASEALEMARAAFAEAPEFVANQVELLNLELTNLIEADLNVPRDLTLRLRDLSSNAEIEHHGYWLLARAHFQRFRHRFRSAEYRNSQVLSELGKTRSALRNAIHRRPVFPSGYLLLAESFVVLEEEEERLARSGNTIVRNIAEPEFEKAISILKAVPEPTLATHLQLANYLSRSGRLKEARPLLETVTALRPSLLHFGLLMTNYLETDDAASLRIITKAAGDPAATTDERSEAIVQRARQLEDTMENLPRIESTMLSFLHHILSSADRPAADEEVVEAVTEAVPTEIEARRLFRLRLLEKLADELHASTEGTGYAHIFMAQFHAQEKTRTRDEDEQKQLHAAMMAQYQAARAAYEDAGSPVPLQVLNNLAWYLVDEGDEGPHEPGGNDERDEQRLAQGLELAKEAKKRVTDVKKGPNIVDTYAWALYQNKHLIRAEEEYRSLISEVAAPSYRFRFARVLFDLNKLEEADTQLRVALRSAIFPEKQQAKKLKDQIFKLRREALGRKTAGR